MIPRYEACSLAYRHHCHNSQIPSWANLRRELALSALGRFKTKKTSGMNYAWKYASSCRRFSGITVFRYFVLIAAMPRILLGRFGNGVAGVGNVFARAGNGVGAASQGHAAHNRQQHQDLQSHKTPLIVSWRLDLTTKTFVSPLPRRQSCGGIFAGRAGSHTGFAGCAPCRAFYLAALA
jgi:hypothetical protein